VMRALELIHRGAVVDRATSDAILEVLALQEISYFRRELPPGVRFAGRSGSGPTFRCDAGIVLLENNPYIFSIMIDGIATDSQNRRRDYARADELITRASRIAFEHFSRSGPRPAGNPPRK